LEIGYPYIPIYQYFNRKFFDYKDES